MFIIGEKKLTLCQVSKQDQALSCNNIQRGSLLTLSRGQNLGYSSDHLTLHYHLVGLVIRGLEDSMVVGVQ